MFSESHPKHPTEGTLLLLKNKNTGRILKCYMKTLNQIIDALPAAFDLLKQLPNEGPDTKFMETDICSYGKNKIVTCVQRYKNKLCIMVQMKYDREGNGKFAFSSRAVQFSSEDNLEELRNFGHTMIEKYIEFKNQQAIALTVDEEDEGLGEN